jgi:hypothetical protein
MICIITKKPGEGAVPFDCSGELADMQAIVGGYIQYVPGDSLGLPDGVDMYVNEEGKNIGLTPNLRLWHGADQAWGTVYFVGADSDGENRSLTEEESLIVFAFCERNAL